MKLQAKMVPCPGVINDGIVGHSYRDGCWSCAPFWEQYPLCPVHETKLSQALFCRTCRKFYARPERLSLAEYRGGAR